MARVLQPELLDSLPPDHPDALHNRRDLRLTNHIAGNYRWFLRTLPRCLRRGERILELGAGTGELGLLLARRGIQVDGLDRWPRPANWPASQAWHVTDLRTFDGYDAYDVVLGNLILHQFTETELAGLGEKIRRRARLVLACEPERQRLSQHLFRVLGPLLGANHVTLHDAPVSIAAGFDGDELPSALGLLAPEWDVQVNVSFLGAYRMIASRAGSDPLSARDRVASEGFPPRETPAGDGARASRLWTALRASAVGATSMSLRGQDARATLDRVPNLPSDRRAETRPTPA